MYTILGKNKLFGKFYENLQENVDKTKVCRHNKIFTQKTKNRKKAEIRWEINTK